MTAPSADPAPPPPRRTATPLTPRELEVLARLATGAPTVTIAADLGLSPATVKTHLTNAYRKAGVNNRVAATRYYLDHHGPGAHPAGPAAPDDGRERLTAEELERRIAELQGVSVAADRLRRRLERLRATSAPDDPASPVRRHRDG